jgi:hypothetical protein
LKKLRRRGKLERIRKLNEQGRKESDGGERGVIGTVAGITRTDTKDVIGITGMMTTMMSFEITEKCFLPRRSWNLHGHCL